MILDIAIEDSLLQSIHALTCFSRDIEIVPNNSLFSQTLDSLIISLLHCRLHPVMFCEDMADKRPKHLIFVIFDELMVFR